MALLGEWVEKVCWANTKEVDQLRKRGKRIGLRENMLARLRQVVANKVLGLEQCTKDV
ncbi:hypothetical protein GCM10028805_39610 [Spirosoma harenae]